MIPRSVELKDKGEQMLLGRAATELWHIVFFVIQISLTNKQLISAAIRLQKCLHTFDFVLFPLCVPVAFVWHIVTLPCEA